MRPSMMHVVIPEPITSLNKGEAGILDGIYQALKLCGDVRLTVYSPPGWIHDDRRNYANKYNVVSGVDLLDIENAYRDNPIPRTRIHFLRTWGKLIVFAIIASLSKHLANVAFKDELLKTLSEAHLIVAGHDGMLGYQDFWLVLAARIMGVPVALFGGGNDLKGRSKYRIRKFFQFAVNHSILCTVRDTGTSDYLILNGISSEKIDLFPDPAVLVEPCNKERVKEIMKIEGMPEQVTRPLYGLVPVRGGIVFDKSFSSEKGLEMKHKLRVKLWVDLIEHLLKITDAHFVLIPHSIGPVPMNDDRKMNRDIYNALPYGKERVTLIENEYSAGELKGLIGNCAFVMGERTHALIGAISVGIPCIALAVEEDLRMRHIITGMFKRKVFNLNNPDIFELKKLLKSEWENREQIAREMKKGADCVREEAYRAARLLKERIEKGIRN
jgi:polysaccharide pyruvyl transferase WcaK-like protein